MTTPPQLPPAKIDRKVLQFCERLSPGQTPFYVPVRPEPWAKMMDCFPNVLEKVRVAGGSLIHGWQISEMPKIHLEAQFHGIWRSPRGAFVDVTREEFGQSRILFVIDVHRSYTGTRLPNERFCLGQREDVERYWRLTDQIRERQEAFLLGGFGHGHPVLRQEMGTLVAEVFALHEKLQNAQQTGCRQCRGHAGVMFMPGSCTG